VNYGPRLGEPKGVVGPVRVGDAVLRDLRVRALDPDRLATAPAGRSGAVTFLAGPVLARAELEVAEAVDLFVDTAGWGRGVVWVNGFCLGRYWRRGPQRTLYVPGPVLRAGTNDVTVLELDAAADPWVRTLPDLDLGHTEE
jgi:beta-galactosidase